DAHRVAWSFFGIVPIRSHANCTAGNEHAGRRERFVRVHNWSMGDIHQVALPPATRSGDPTALLTLKFGRDSGAIEFPAPIRSIGGCSPRLFVLPWDLPVQRPVASGLAPSRPPHSPNRSL